MKNGFNKETTGRPGIFSSQAHCSLQIHLALTNPSGPDSASQEALSFQTVQHVEIYVGAERKAISTHPTRSVNSDSPMQFETLAHHVVSILRFAPSAAKDISLKIMTHQHHTEGCPALLADSPAELAAEYPVELDTSKLLPGKHYALTIKGELPLILKAGESVTTGSKLIAVVEEVSAHYSIDAILQSRDAMQRRRVVLELLNKQITPDSLAKWSAFFSVELVPATIPQCLEKWINEQPAEVIETLYGAREDQSAFATHFANYTCGEEVSAEIHAFVECDAREKERERTETIRSLEAYDAALGLLQEVIASQISRRMR